MLGIVKRLSRWSVMLSEAKHLEGVGFFAAPRPAYRRQALAGLRSE